MTLEKRTRYSRLLASSAYTRLPTIELMNARENTAASISSPTAHEVPKWSNLRVRFDQLALIQFFQSRHLKATGKEISRAEVMAACMAFALPHMLDRPEFSATTGWEGLPE
jgi:hypothetical protein